MGIATPGAAGKGRERPSRRVTPIVLPLLAVAVFACLTVVVLWGGAAMLATGYSD